MAAWPCMACDQRFPGEAQNLYLTYFLGDEREAYRFVMCPGCVDELITPWRARALFRNAEGEWEWHEPSNGSEPRTVPSEPLEGVRSRRNGPKGHLTRLTGS